jgi:uncharacterized membrane protein YoaK (UPF0700 family)
MSMVHVEVKDLYKNKYALLWSILSFKAGLINSAGFLIAGSYVSHVTGFGTQMGIAMGHADYQFGIDLLVIPIFFILGAFLTSMILDKSYSKDAIPNYPIVQSIITFLLGLISICFFTGVFHSIAPNQQNLNSIILISLLCLICGLKNGLTTWATHGKIRTTHLTGLSTDIGLHLLKVFRPEGSHSRYPEPKKVTYIRLLTLFSFSVGAFLSALLIPMISYKIFYIAFLISIVLYAVSVVHRASLINSLTHIGGAHENTNEGNAGKDITVASGRVA